MKRFSDQYIQDTINTLISGGDYRNNIVNSIIAEFFDFTVDFFKKIVEAKMGDKSITLDW